ncbi:hypothetical protein [Brassicibacter mesophilus]|uniref:hypothetical protein n=1 Tax=Brassicibacter mesophilus TaxID=745119 RepID=UPI003D1C8056
MSMKIESINVFANECGYFYNAYLEDNFSCNNGYNCKHPEQIETDINKQTGEEIGKCYSWSCPLAVEAGEEDFNNPNIDNQGYEYEESEFVVIEE